MKITKSVANRSLIVAAGLAIGQFSGLVRAGDDAERLALADQSIRCAALYSLSYPEKEKPVADHETKEFWVRGYLGLAVLHSDQNYVSKKRFELAANEILSETERIKTQSSYKAQLQAYMKKSVDDCTSISVNAMKHGLPLPKSMLEQ